MYILLSEHGIVLDDAYGVEVTKRNRVVLDAVRAATDQKPDQHISLVWGTGHGSGLAKGLQQQGYTQVDRDWRDVMSVGEGSLAAFFRWQVKRQVTAR